MIDKSFWRERKEGERKEKPPRKYGTLVWYKMKSVGDQYQMAQSGEYGNLSICIAQYMGNIKNLKKT